jgi:hypothetical protein
MSTVVGAAGAHSFEHPSAAVMAAAAASNLTPAGFKNPYNYEFISNFK